MGFCCVDVTMSLKSSGLKNSKEWSKIKNSLPGAKSILDNTPRNIDIHKPPVQTDKPYITIFPRK